MSQSVPPQQQGQVTTPNPLELFWEKNRRTLTTIAAGAVFGLGLYYVLQYIDRRAQDARASAFMQATGLDVVYADPEAPPQNPQEANLALVTGLFEDIGEARIGDIDLVIEEHSDSGYVPFALWAAGRSLHEKARQAEDGDEQAQLWDRAVEYLRRLEEQHPDHPLCVTTDFPVQVREQKEKDEEQESDNGEEQESDNGEEPELEDPVAGSEVGRLLAEIERERAFVREGRGERFSEPTPAPEGAPRIRISFSGFGDVEIDIFEEAAPRHWEILKGLITETPGEGQPYFEGLRVNRIDRASRAFQPEAFQFGFPSTRDDDRTQWVTTEDPPEGHAVEIDPNEQQRRLSHFPGTLSASTFREESVASRLWILASEGAANFDGQRIILGRVTPETMEVVQAIVEAPLSTEQEEQQGRGKPRSNITIEKVDLVR